MVEMKLKFLRKRNLDIKAKMMELTYIQERLAEQKLSGMLKQQKKQKSRRPGGQSQPAARAVCNVGHIFRVRKAGGLTPSFSFCAQLAQAARQSGQILIAQDGQTEQPSR